jgi:hypothetical protein
LRDAAKAREFWTTGSTEVQAWWPNSLTDPNTKGATAVTDEAAHQHIPQWHSTKRHISSRAFSILLALLADVGLIWLLFYRQSWSPSAGEIESFWVGALIAFAAYSVIQLWTLAYQTGRGDELAATVDKVFAASPALVAALIEVYWIGHDSATAMSWRHHVIAAVWAVFAVADFFATDITNQRLRMRQMNFGQPAD